MRLGDSSMRWTSLASTDIVRDVDGSYLNISDNEFRRRIRVAYARLAVCDLCPRRCRARRLAGAVGACGVALKPRVFVWNVHRGEEPPVSGTRGSGTVFLSGCNLSCCYCQNYPLSQLRHGREIPVDDLADALMRLQMKGVHNINFVTPSHQIPQILAGLYRARAKGLHIPVVYNTSSYDDPETLKLLDGVVDIYLADLRYTSEDAGLALSGISDYVAVAQSALMEMHRQVGDITVDAQGRYVPRGVIVRYLILPRHTDMADAVFGFVRDRLSPQTCVSVMTQYFPAYKAHRRSFGVYRKVTDREFDTVMKAWDSSGLKNGWVQEPDENGGA